MNNKLINNQKEIILLSKMFLTVRKIEISDPLFLEADPRIRLQIRMKRIHNTDSYYIHSFVLFVPYK